MKTSNYLAKLPQEASIRQVQAFQDYDLITLDLPAPRQRLCPHCGSIDCVIKDSGSWQTVRHIPSHHRGHDRLFLRKEPWKHLTPSQILPKRQSQIFGPKYYYISPLPEYELHQVLYRQFFLLYAWSVFQL